MPTGRTRATVRAGGLVAASAGLLAGSAVAANPARAGPEGAAAGVLLIALSLWGARRLFRWGAARRERGS